jgi:pimeloyl-ACP methyl ester carboxylesterase
MLHKGKMYGRVDGIKPDSPQQHAEHVDEEVDERAALSVLARPDRGEKDRAGSCVRYNKAWHKKTGIPIEWIKGAGHNSNTDEPDIVNKLIEEFVLRI